MRHYLLIINGLGFALMFIDKYKATHHKWRISEKTLILIALIGGSVGSFLGMILAHHKVSKKKFIIGIPIIIIGQIILTYLLLVSNKV